MQEPLLAVKEMTRCIKELKFPGVQIGSHINDWNLDAEELAVFWKVLFLAIAFNFFIVEIVEMINVDIARELERKYRLILLELLET